MANLFFDKNINLVKSKLSLTESVEDVETMFSIIVKARREQKHLGEEDERIALWSLCFLAAPWKTPRYADEVKRFRSHFTGISIQKSLQVEFRKTIKQPLLEADNVNLLAATKFSDLFDKADGSDEPIDPIDRGGNGGSSSTSGGQTGIVEVTADLQASVASSSHNQVSQV